MKKIILGIGVLLLMVYLASQVAATVLVKKDLEQLTMEAVHIVIGTVKNTEGKIESEERGRIFTYVTLEIEQEIKGSAPKKDIVFRHPGGWVGDKSMFVPGSPTFARNGKILVFLAPERRSGHLMVVGWIQGKYTITGDHAVNQALRKDILLKDLVNDIKARMTSQKEQP